MTEAKLLFYDFSPRKPFCSISETRPISFRKRIEREARPGNVVPTAYRIMSLERSRGAFLLLSRRLSIVVILEIAARPTEKFLSHNFCQ